MNTTLTDATTPTATSIVPSTKTRLRTVNSITDRPVLMTVFLSFVGAMLLQIWRPFFFLTDDAIADWLPVAVDSYRRLWSGRWPFQNDYLYGGFNLLDDAGSFTFVGLWALLSSILAKTRFYYAIPDVIGTLSVITAAASFCWSALNLRQRFSLPITPGWIIVLSLSYAFTPFNFIVNASWVGFFNAPAALPVIFAGAFERRWRRALTLQTLALAYAIFGGHMHPFTVLVMVAGLLVVAVAIVERRWQPLFVWAGAGTIIIVLALPLLIPALAGFGQDTRSAGLSVAQASFQRVPLLPLLGSFALGPASNMFQEGIRIDLSDSLYGLAIAFAAVNLPLLGALACRRRLNGVEICLLTGLLCTAVSIVRPYWLGDVYAHLPLLRSLRWPFREIATLHFFSHTLFLFVFLPVTIGPRRLVMLTCGIGGALAYALVFACAAPTFWLFGPDRQLLISGEAARYWQALKTSGDFRAGVPFIVEAEPDVLAPRRPLVPFSVIGGFDYAAIFETRNLSGFSATPPAGARILARDAGVEPYFWGGVYTHDEAERVLRARPGTQRIVLTAMSPPCWQIDNGTSVRQFRLDSGCKVVALPPP